jgi:hypothetical protein
MSEPSEFEIISPENRELSRPSTSPTCLVKNTPRNKKLIGLLVIGMVGFGILFSGTMLGWFAQKNTAKLEVASNFYITVYNGSDIIENKNTSYYMYSISFSFITGDYVLAIYNLFKTYTVKQAIDYMNSANPLQLLSEQGYNGPTTLQSQSFSIINVINGKEEPVNGTSKTETIQLPALFSAVLITANYDQNQSNYFIQANKYNFDFNSYLLTQPNSSMVLSIIPFLQPNIDNVFGINGITYNLTSQDIIGIDVTMNGINFKLN